MAAHLPLEPLLSHSSLGDCPPISFSHLVEVCGDKEEVGDIVHTPSGPIQSPFSCVIPKSRKEKQKSKNIYIYTTPKKIERKNVPKFLHLF